MFGRKLSSDRLRDSVAERVRDIVSRTCGRKDISHELDLARDLHLDVVDRAELLTSVELAFHVDISENEQAEMSTIGDIITMMVEKTHVDEPSLGAGSALLEAIERLAVSAAKARRTIDLDVAPELLLQHHRGAGSTTEEVAVEIERAAAKAGARVSRDTWRQRA